MVKDLKRYVVYRNHVKLRVRFFGKSNRFLKATGVSENEFNELCFNSFLQVSDF